MKTLNRSAILVTPKEEYIEWAAQIDPDATSLAESLRGRTAVYLVEGAESDEEASRILRRRSQSIFEAELRAWSEDTVLWPKTRDFATFRAWLSPEIQSLVIDLAEANLAEE